MSAREVISLFEALPLEGQREVLAFVESKKAEIVKKAPGKNMSFKDAKKHVFTTYRDVLEKLAK